MEVFMPKISVIMPVYNCEKYLHEAIDSVLNQSYRDFEFIVVDDGSIDKSREIIVQYEQKNYPFFRAIYHDKNRGVSAAQNSAISIASGQFLVIAAADDIQEHDKLEISINAFNENPNLDMVFTDCQMMDEQSRTLNRYKGYPAGMNSRNAVVYQLKRNHLWSGLAMIRKTADILFDETIPNAVDYELFLRLLLKGAQINIINTPLVRYRVHENNISGNRKVSGKSVEKILQRLNFDDIFNNLCQKYDKSEVRVAMASALLTSGQLEQALIFLQDIDLPSSLLVEGLFIQAITYYKLGRIQESLNSFKYAQNASSEDAAILNNIGVLSIILNGQRKDACELFEKALFLRPGYLDAISNIRCLNENKFDSFRITERPLRDNFIHVENYKL